MSYDGRGSIALRIAMIPKNDLYVFSSTTSPAGMSNLKASRNREATSNAPAGIHFRIEFHVLDTTQSWANFSVVDTTIPTTPKDSISPNKVSILENFLSLLAA